MVPHALSIGLQGGSHRCVNSGYVLRTGGWISLEGLLIGAFKCHGLRHIRALYTEKTLSTFCRYDFVATFPPLPGPHRITVPPVVVYPPVQTPTRLNNGCAAGFTTTPQGKRLRRVVPNHLSAVGRGFRTYKRAHY